MPAFHEYQMPDPVSGDTARIEIGVPRTYVQTLTLTGATPTSASIIETTVTVTGLTTNDTILAVNPPSGGGTATFISHFRVSSANTLALGIASITGTTLPVTGTYRIVAVRSSR